MGRNKAYRDRLNQVKQADSELDQQIASREAEIERLKQQIGRGGNSDLSGGSMFRGPGEKKRSGRVEALFQKLESASQSPYQGRFYICNANHHPEHWKALDFNE